jgi:hypothetical protein
VQLTVYSQIWIELQITVAQISGAQSAAVQH